MHIFSHAGKLLSVAALVSSLGTTLVNGGFAQATGAAGTPFTGSVNPNPVVILATTGNLQSTFGLDIMGVDPGSTINTFTDTASSSCTETINGAAIGSGSLSADANGRAHGTFLLSSCSSLVPGLQTIAAHGTVNGSVVTNGSLATYTLEGARP
jgi:hypothetical protein